MAERWERTISPGDFIARCQQLLERQPNAPLSDRVSWATVVAADANCDAAITYGDIADVAGISMDDVAIGLLAIQIESVTGDG